MTGDVTVWTPDQIRAFRTLLVEGRGAFGLHWVVCEATGRAASDRTVEAWEQGRRRPHFFVRAQLGSAWTHLLRRRPEAAAHMPADPVTPAMKGRTDPKNRNPVTKDLHR